MAGSGDCPEEKASVCRQSSRGHHAFFRLNTFPMDLARVLFAPLFPFFRIRKRSLDGRKYTKKIRGGAIIAANHTSFADPLIVVATFWYRRQYFLAGEAVMEGKGNLVPLLLKGLGAIEIDRNKADIKAINTSVEKLREGYLLTVFPQGKILREDDVTALKAGAVLMAVKANVPIIPVHIGKREKWYKKRSVVIGNPVDPMDFANGGTLSMAHIKKITNALASQLSLCKDANTHQ